MTTGTVKVVRDPLYFYCYQGENTDSKIKVSALWNNMILFNSKVQYNYMIRQQAILRFQMRTGDTTSHPGIIVM